MEQRNELKVLEEKSKIAKKAITSGQNVDIYSDYYAQDEKLVIRIEIKKTNEEFFNLQEGMISKEQAEQLSTLKDKNKSSGE